MSFTMGRAPEPFTLILVNDADFIDALIRKDGTDWPSTLVVTLEFATTVPVVWDATLNGSRLEWNVDVAEVMPVITARPKKVKLWYVDGEVRILWAVGSVTYK